MITAAVIGRGGLLGSALARELRLRPEWRETVAPAAPWRDGPDAVRAWARDLGEALARDADGGPWSILWTAGAAVTASGRDDVEAEIFVTYMNKGVFTISPFETIDQLGIGRLVRMGAEEGRATKPGLKLGVCGEHGGDPESIHFFHQVGLDYVSCSPFRVPVARLEAGRSAVLG